MVVSDLSSQLNQIFGDWAMIMTSIPVISDQASFDLSLLETLPDDQNLQKQHALDFENILSPIITSVFQYMVTTNYTLTNFSEQLLPLANYLDANKDDGSTEYQGKLLDFRNILKELQVLISATYVENSESISEDLQKVAAAISDFYTEKIEDDAIRIETDLQTGEVKYAADISSLQSQIADLQSKINAANSQLSMGAVSKIPEALSFGFSIAKTVTGDTSSGAIALNAGMEIAKEVLSLIKFEDEYNALSTQISGYVQQYGQLITQEKDEKQEISILITLAQQAATIATLFENMNQSSSSLSTSFAGINNQFEYFLSLDESPEDDFFTESIEDAVQFWNTISKECQAYLSASVVQ